VSTGGRLDRKNRSRSRSSRSFDQAAGDAPIFGDRHIRHSVTYQQITETFLSYREIGPISMWRLAEYLSARSSTKAIDYDRLQIDMDPLVAFFFMRLSRD